VTLPIDPTALDAEDVGEHRTQLEMAHDEAVEHVRSAFVDAGFGVATEFSPADMLNEKVDAGRDPYTVIGACNPEMADRALDASDRRIGGLFPCNVVVWEEADGLQTVYHVSIMKIARLAGLAPDDEEMDAIVSDTGDLVATAWAAL
jgi:uncharacterized protein (DUF302 family)